VKRGPPGLLLHGRIVTPNICILRDRCNSTEATSWRTFTAHAQLGHSMAAGFVGGQDGVEVDLELLAGDALQAVANGDAKFVSTADPEPGHSTSWNQCLSIGRVG
jgi:hypothetical protein